MTGTGRRAVRRAVRSSEGAVGGMGAFRARAAPRTGPASRAVRGPQGVGRTGETARRERDGIVMVSTPL